MTQDQEPWEKRKGKFNSNSPEVHSSIYPADVRPQERIVTRVRLREGTEEFESVRTWRISPLGIEVNHPTVPLMVGDLVELEIVLAGQRTTFNGLVVTIERVDSDNEIVGVRYSQALSDHNPQDDRRSAPRWSCSPNYFPLAVAPSPTYFDDWMYFQIHDVSNTGMQLNTSLSNKYLVQGIHLQLTAVFPMGGSVAIRGEIARVNIGSFGSEDRLVVGIKFISLDKQAKRIIGQYLIQFSSSANLDSFREHGFIPRSVLKGVKFGNVKTEDQYKQVLDLRFRANQASNQLKNIAAPIDLADMGDSRSRIIIGTRNDKVVATARISFPSRAEPTEAENYLRWPDELPHPDQIFEISRLAIDPHFQHSDVLAGLFRYIALTCISADRRHCVLATMDKYRPFYRNIGFSDTGLSYQNDAWSEELHVMIADTLEGMKGKHVHPLYWGRVWMDVANILISTGLIEPTALDKARMLGYRALSPIATALLSVTKTFQKLGK